MLLSTSSSLWRRVSSPCVALRVPTTLPLRTQHRPRSFRFYMNLNDPTETRRHVEEELARLAQEHQRDTMAHLHAMLNLSLSHFQAGDYVTARAYAEAAHTQTRERNPNATLLFFTAKTCAKCASAVADVYADHLRETEAAAKVSSALTPRHSALFSAQRTIAKLREEARRYEGIARRMYNRPDKAFMRGAAPRGGWEEDETGKDEDAQEVYGEAWQERRKRPEHAALRQHFQQQQRNGQGVPK